MPTLTWIAEARTRPQDRQDLELTQAGDISVDLFSTAEPPDPTREEGKERFPAPAQVLTACPLTLFVANSPSYESLEFSCHMFSCF